MFAFTDPQRVFEILTGAGWAPPRLDKLDLDLDIAAGRGLDEAVVQSTQIGAVIAGCATSLRRSSQPPSRPSARRWRRIWTARACACAVRCGWSAVRLSERAPPLTNFVQCMSELAARPSRDDPPPSCPMLEV